MLALMCYVVCFALGWETSKPLLSRREFDKQRDEVVEIGSTVLVGILSLLWLTRKVTWRRKFIVLIGCWLAFLFPAALAQLIDTVDEHCEDEAE